MKYHILMSVRRAARKHTLKLTGAFMSCCTVAVVRKHFHSVRVRGNDVCARRIRRASGGVVSERVVWREFNLHVCACGFRSVTLARTLASCWLRVRVAATKIKCLCVSASLYTRRRRTYIAQLVRGGETLYEGSCTHVRARTRVAHMFST